MGIQEIKRRNLDESIIRSIWGSLDFEFMVKGSAGQGGGLMCIWDKDLFSKEQVIMRQDCIVVQGRWNGNNKNICLINIYASQEVNERYELWSFLSDVLSNWEGTVVLFGDFNEVISGDERRGSVFDPRSAETLKIFIKNNLLIDCKIGGRNFTWANGNGTKLSRLDRVMVSKCFAEAWPEFEVIAEHRLHSDHVPLVLKEIRRDYGPTPFKLNNSWMDEEGFEDMVKDVWENYVVPGNSNGLFAILKKCKELKGRIRSWSQEKLSRRKAEYQKSMGEILEVERKIDNGAASELDMDRRELNMKKIVEIKKAEDEDIKQRFKYKWCLEGDENSTLYHRCINKKKQKSGIKGIMKDGSWETNPEVVKECFFDHFSQRYSEEEDQGWTQDIFRDQVSV